MGVTAVRVTAISAALTHFRYPAGGLYIEQAELDRVRDELRHQVEWEVDIDE